MSFRRCGDLADIRYQKGGRDLPLKCPKFREPAEVPFINRNHSNANSGGTHGNERVIRARLSDAKFFYETDLKTRLEDRLPKFEQIVFHEKLGTQAQRIARIEMLAGHPPHDGRGHSLRRRVLREQLHLAKARHRYPLVSTPGLRRFPRAKQKHKPKYQREPGALVG